MWAIYFLGCILSFIVYFYALTHDTDKLTTGEILLLLLATLGSWFTASIAALLTVSIWANIGSRWINVKPLKKVLKF